MCAAAAVTAIEPARHFHRSRPAFHRSRPAVPPWPPPSSTPPPRRHLGTARLPGERGPGHERPLGRGALRASSPYRHFQPAQPRGACPPQNE